MNTRLVIPFVLIILVIVILLVAKTVMTTPDQDFDTEAAATQYATSWYTTVKQIENGKYRVKIGGIYAISFLIVMLAILFVATSIEVYYMWKEINVEVESVTRRGTIAQNENVV